MSGDENKREELFIDDNETENDLLITDISAEELDAEYNRLFNSEK